MSAPAEPAVTAQLSVRRGRAAVDFYRAAFGAEEIYRVGGTDSHEAVVSQLRVGATTFWVADESPEHGNFSPETLLGRHGPHGPHGAGPRRIIREGREVGQPHRNHLGNSCNR